MKQASGHEMKWNPGKGQDGRTYIHRDVAAKKLGRPLKANEVVHHVDGNPQNNKPSNLKVMTKGDHNKTPQLRHGGRTKGS